MVSEIHANGFRERTQPTMALDQSALLDVLDMLKAAEVDDRIRQAAETLYQALIEAELTAVIGAHPHQRTEARTAQRNGHRLRTLASTAGDLELKIPRLRTGSFFPSLLERRRRVDQSLFAVIMEAYLHGTSTRKAGDLVKALGADSGISKSEVSRICGFTPAVRAPALTWPVSSTAPTASPRGRPVLRAASSSPATANRRTTPIAAKVSQTARLSSRCVRSGVRSPERSAILHPFGLRKSLITAAAYLPACSHGPVRAKHGRSPSSSSARFRRASAAPILAAAAAVDSVVLTNA